MLGQLFHGKREILGRKAVKSQMEPDLKDIVDTCMGVCLRYLVDKGFVIESQLEGNWYSREASDRLGKRSFVAAGSIDNDGRPVVFFQHKHAAQSYHLFNTT